MIQAINWCLFGLSIVFVLFQSTRLIRFPKHIVLWLYSLLNLGFYISLGYLLLNASLSSSTSVTTALWMMRLSFWGCEWLVTLLLVEATLVFVSMAHTHMTHIRYRLMNLRIMVTSAIVLSLLAVAIVHALLISKTNNTAGPKDTMWVQWYTYTLAFIMALTFWYSLRWSWILRTRMAIVHCIMVSLFLTSLILQGIRYMLLSTHTDLHVMAMVQYVLFTLSMCFYSQGSDQWSQVYIPLDTLTTDTVPTTATADNSRMDPDEDSDHEDQNDIRPEEFHNKNEQKKEEPIHASVASELHTGTVIVETKSQHKKPTKADVHELENQMIRLSPGEASFMWNRISAQPSHLLIPVMLGEPLSDNRQILSPGCIGTLYYYAWFQQQSQKPNSEAMGQLCIDLESIYNGGSLNKRDLLRGAIQRIQKQYVWGMVLSLSMDFMTSIFHIPPTQREGQRSWPLGMHMEWALYQIYFYHQQRLPHEDTEPSVAHLYRMLVGCFAMLHGAYGTLDEDSKKKVLPVSTSDLMALDQQKINEKQESELKAEPCPEDVNAFVRILTQPVAAAASSASKPIRILQLVQTWKNTTIQQKKHVLCTLLTNVQNDTKIMRWLYHAHTTVTRAYRFKSIFLLVRFVLLMECPDAKDRVLLPLPACLHASYFSCSSGSSSSSSQVATLDEWNESLNHLNHLLNPQQSQRILTWTQEEQAAFSGSNVHFEYKGNVSSLVHTALVLLSLAFWSGQCTNFQPFRAQALLLLFLRDPQHVRLLVEMQKVWDEFHEISPSSLPSQSSSPLINSRFFTLQNLYSPYESSASQEVIRLTGFRIFTRYDFMPISHSVAFVNLLHILTDQATRASMELLDFQKWLCLRLCYGLDEHYGIYPLHTIFSQWPPSSLSASLSSSSFSSSSSSSQKPSAASSSGDAWKKTFLVHDLCEAIFHLFPIPSFQGNSLMYVLYLQLAIVHALVAGPRSPHSCFRDWIFPECEQHIVQHVIRKFMLKRVDLVSDKRTQKRRSVLDMKQGLDEAASVSERSIHIPLSIWNAWSMIPAPVSPASPPTPRTPQAHMLRRSTSASSALKPESLTPVHNDPEGGARRFTFDEKSVGAMARIIEEREQHDVLQAHQKQQAIHGSGSGSDRIRTPRPMSMDPPPKK